jgi:hypothetical protein
MEKYREEMRQYVPSPEFLRHKLQAEEAAAASASKKAGVYISRKNSYPLPHPPMSFVLRIRSFYFAVSESENFPLLNESGSLLAKLKRYIYT